MVHDVFNDVFKNFCLDKGDSLLNRLDQNLSLLNTLVTHYENACKDYQTKIADSIKIPLFLYIGRIIQTYPLGVGITAHVETNQVVFHAGNRNCDAFNILSAGQLSGVMLSVLLAARSVFSTQTGLDILLIDDPLQSMDDISSISFVDLLSDQFPDTQIIISTHENEKAKLFQYKYCQKRLEAKCINMKDEYLLN